MSWKYCQRSGCGRDALLEQADGEIGAAGSARGRLRQEDGAETVGDDEARIQRRREVQERIEVLERPRPGRAQPGRAEVLDGAHPVEVRGEHVERQRDAPGHGRRLQVEHRRQFALGTLPQRHGLQAHRRGQQHAGADQPRQPRVT